MGSRIKQNPETTFEVYAEVTYSGVSCTGKDPEVRRQFPEGYSDQEVLQTLTKFCFPFYVDSHAVNQVGQNFTFVLTDIDSKQRFGFCRLSSGAKSCFCILSYLPWFEVFYKLLNILADYSAKGQDSQRSELLETFHKLTIPEPGTSVHLGVHSYFTVPDIRELPSIPENRNLTEYFVAVDVNNMLHLYASMLYERRILICCSKLSTLTACIHGSAAMLYPMFWQHVYIPVLPPHLLDYCCAPMPYLIGIHLSLMEKVRNMALEDVVILNVDTNTLETPFDDLQNLPNDVVSALKNRLKKVSTTTGDGVARAFLKAQASFFGSYRNALKIEPGEPITFCEETFVSHRSAVMRQFLQNAIQLQLFKQFIDGRLDLLNSGEGFSDVFEEEINMGEYAGSDKLYHQWLSTVRKGSGAILNTVKTKANPAMKTVYKFAKDHAKMGIKEVKNRLKQKDIAENGCSATPEESLPRTAPSPLVEKKDPKLREDRRPITVHFGQVRPPRPHIVKRPKSNIAVEGRRTSVSSPEQPQPYRALKESDSADGEEAGSPEKPKELLPASPVLSSKATEINLLEDIFPNLEVETQPQPLSQAKSLEDLRTPKEEGDQRCTFDYQRMDLGVSERNRIVPTMKLSHPYNKLWSMGHDDMAIPTKYSQSSPERPLTVLGNMPPITRRPRSRDSILASAEKDESNPAIQGNITIPRPQGRKTPELGIVPPPPAPRASKHQTPAGQAEILTTHATGRSHLVSDLIPEPFGVGSVSLDPEIQQAVNYSSHPSQLLSSATSTAEMLQPVKVKTESTGNESDYLLNLLDPLKTASWQSSGPQQGPRSLQSSAAPPAAAGFVSVASDFVPPAAAPFVQPLGYPSPAPPPFLQPSPNPFTQTVPGALSVSLVRPPRGSFTPSLGHAYSSSFITPNSSFYPPQRPQPHISTLSMPNLFSQAPAVPPARSLLLPSHSPSPAGSLQPACLSGPSKTRTLQLGQSSSKVDPKQALALLSNEPPLIPARPAKGLESVLLSSKSEETKDPFEDLLKKTKQDVSSTPGKVEQLRKRWETFE
ncbi:DENN domain-containing protein 1A isoform X2 [Falco biarmicus]|uniref:DENN domain-containing protein 1A isoform X2 n=1 Tax=Falco cherrug TaxID=345164 RepID=UPI000FFB487D|nr:DENN domain-containing protein 1A isoform X2 [Falco cherrug]XP_037256306.1 DENN domain-containing protein 1A isoform X5 [Falco rusticolus]XP_056208968.1 DENN domain-containing protein 1A isoform X2 [Falco biarmicus]